MLDSILDEISVDELAQLRQELNDFFSAYDAYEWCYGEGNIDAEEVDRNAALKAQLLRKRIKGLAIDWGIHKEFLKQYDDLRQTIAKKALQPQPDLTAF